MKWVNTQATLALLAFVLGSATPAAAGGAGSEERLTASRIVEKNVAARGGLEAWRKIESMAWVGHIESDRAPQPALPFVLEMKRPNKTRFEIRMPGQTSVRMYDGTQGWKLRPGNQGKPGVQPYTPDELSFARDAQGLDGPLMDYQAKGIAIALEGEEEVEGRRAYRLSVRLPSGNSHHVWIDAQTFLDVKYDRISHGKFGQSGTVMVYYRNYRTVEGLQMPLLIETVADQSSAPAQARVTDHMVIDRVILNPSLDDMVFTNTGTAGRGRAGAGSGHPQSYRILPPGNSGAPLRNAHGLRLEQP